MVASRSNKRERYNHELEQAKFALLSDLAAARLDELLDEFGAQVFRRGKMLAGCCPVHGGDNPTAFNVYPDGYAIRGNWKCRTHGCHKVFKPTLIGLVRGLISRQRLGWEPGQAKIADFMPTVHWLCDFVGQKWVSLSPDLSRAEKQRFVGAAATFNRSMGPTGEGWPRSVLERRLDIPSPYFLGRGYSAEVLRTFGVGDSRVEDKAHAMYWRAVVPVFDADGKLAVGATGRSKHDCCKGCGRWHDAALPCPTGIALRHPSVAKWRNSTGFARERHLYGFDAALAEIRRTGVVILVEGPGDLWRLYESGVRNAVALFGAELTDAQQVLLEASGALTVVPLLDKDAAGAAAVVAIERELARAFRVSRVSWQSSGKDVGDLTVAEVKDGLMPVLAKVKGW